MSDLRDELEKLQPPSPRPGFHDSLWQRIDSQARASSRFWRTIAVAAIVVALAASSAASVLAFDAGSPAVVDRTLACPVALNGEIDLFAHVKGPSMRLPGTWIKVHNRAVRTTKIVPRPALVEFDTGRAVLINAGASQIVQTTLAGAYAGSSLTAKAGYTLDGSDCTAAKTIPLSSDGLRPAGVFTGTGGAGIYRECGVAQPATFRARLTLAKNGLPVAAKLAIRSGKKLRPIAYIDWTPTRVRAWLAPGCQQYTELAP